MINLLLFDKSNFTMEEMSKLKLVVPPIDLRYIEKNGKKYIEDDDRLKYVIKCIIKCKDGYVVQHNPLFDGRYEYCVYKHTNVNNGKVYIGLTNKDPEERWGIDGKGYSKQYFGIVIKNEGWHNFTHEVCYNNLSLDEAVWLEQQLIYDYNANDPECGYNKTDGGEFGHVDVDLLKKPICVYSGFGNEIKLFKEFESIKDFAESGYTSYSYSEIIKCCKSTLRADNKLKRCNEFFVCYKEYQNYFESILSYWLVDNMDAEEKRKERFNKSKNTFQKQKRKSAGPGK